MGCAGTPSARIQQAFDAVRAARDQGVAKVSQAIATRQDLRGYQVDDAVRDSLVAANLADNFVHRTGHSIGTEVHGTGANMDNFETHDDRRILPGALFSIEPGVYFPDFGIRLELDMFVNRDGTATPTGEVQTAMVPLL